MEYVTNGYAIEKYSIDFTKRLSTKNARIYQKPVTRLAMLQSDLAYVANEIYPTNRAEYQVRRALLSLSMAILHALDKRMADVYENLMVNPSDAFNRQNGKPIPQAEAVRILDKLADDRRCRHDIKSPADRHVGKDPFSVHGCFRSVSHDDPASLLRPGSQSSSGRGSCRSLRHHTKGCAARTSGS